MMGRPRTKYYMEDQLKELFQFLRDQNPQVRNIALSNLVGQTAQESPYRHIFLQGIQRSGLQKPQEPDVIRDLKLLCRDQLATAHDAFRALVNLSDSTVLVPFLVEQSFLTYLVSYILNPDAILADLASMLLSNITASYYTPLSRSGTCPAPVPYPSGEQHEILALPLLIDAFVQGATLDQSGDKSNRARKGDLHFLSSAFANISTSPAGRLFFVTPRPTDPVKPSSALEYPLAKILPFTEHQDIIRRGGVASTLKNCAFHAPAHKAILSPETDLAPVPPSTVAAPGIDALPYILLPLAGPEELDLEDQEKLPPALQFLPSTKKREPDPVLRLTHVETLLLLCTTRWGREYMRTHGVYEIVRGAHLEEAVDKVSEHIERLVQLVKGEEDPETIDDDAVAIKSEEKAVPSDEEDYRIEEV
ncbi:hypothetical protein EDD15DRAFT_2385862 [Pisolithus albus]|nr:hypothetical protein EDD15DRAFT_2385862 [Pisolithus albus]